MLADSWQLVATPEPPLSPSSDIANEGEHTWPPVMLVCLLGWKLDACRGLSFRSGVCCPCVSLDWPAGPARALWQARLHSLPHCPQTLTGPPSTRLRPDQSSSDSSSSTLRLPSGAAVAPPASSGSSRSSMSTSGGSVGCSGCDSCCRRTRRLAELGPGSAGADGCALRSASSSSLVRPA